VTRRLPWLALLVLGVGLALHNLAMALLWQAGLRDTALDVAAAWKDALLLAALAVALAGARRIPLEHWADRLALGYAAIVVLYWLVPQSWLGGAATERGELLALRHHLLPVGAYLLGRLLALSAPQWRRVGLVLVGVAAAVAVWGLVDVSCRSSRSREVPSIGGYPPRRRALARSPGPPAAVGPWTREGVDPG
jgi:hypothetical protein